MKKKTILIIAGAVAVVEIVAVLYFFVLKKGITVTFNSNGGTKLTDIVLKEGEAITLPEITKEGAIFDGWYIGDTKVNDKTVFEKDVELEARWITEIGKEYTVTFDSKGGTSIRSILMKEGDTLILPPNPTKEGYTFVTWQDKNEMPITSGTVLAAEDIILYAKWN